MKRLSAFTAVLVVLSSSALFAADTPQAPKELVKVLRYYPGKWSVTGSLGDAVIKGKASFRMPAGKHCIIGTVSFESKGETTHFSLVSGWDSSTGWSIEQGLGSDGGVYVLKWRKVSGTVEEGDLVGTLNGKKMTEKDRLVRKSDDEFVVTCTERKVGDESQPDLTIVYKRISREKSKRKGGK